MTLSLRQSSDLTLMQATGTPEEVADLVHRFGLLDVPLVVCEDDVLSDIDMTGATAQ